MSTINTPSEMSSTYIHKYNLKNMSDIILIDFALRKYFNQFPRNCKFDVFCQKIWKSILNHEDVVFNKEENMIWADIQSLIVDGQNTENSITICDLKEIESISLETFFYNIFNILDCSIRFIEYKTNILQAFLSAKKIPHDEIILVLFKELDEIEIVQLIKNSHNDNSINSKNTIKLKYFEKIFELIESFLISCDFSVEPSFYSQINRFLKEFDIFQNKSSDLFCQFMVKIISVGILLDSLKIDDCKVVLNSIQKDQIFIKNFLIELIRLFAINSISKSNILDKREKNVSYIQDSISIEHVLKTRISSQLMTKIDFSTVQNFIILIFTTKPFFVLNEKYQAEICSEIYKYMNFQLVQKIQNNQILQQNINILPVLQAISYQTDSRYNEQYHHLFSEKITEFFKNRELFKLQKIIEYFAVFVVKNEMTPDIYDFLKFDASTYKNFLIAFFKKIPIKKTLFHHVQSFFDYFLKTENLVFVDVFNFIPFISREHKNLLDIFYYIHQIMCQKYCYKNYYDGSFEKLMLPFLLRMPALFYKKNDHLIYHSEKLKLQNYNYSGILEYLQDESTLSCDLKKVFRKMHTEIKLRNEFKEEYIRKIILLALKNEYESADQLIIIILECLFDNFVYDFPRNDSSSVYSKFSNDKSLIFQREQSNYSLLDVNNDGFSKIDTCSTVKQSFSFNENEFEKVTRKEIQITYLIYSFEFHQKFQLLIQREFAYMSIYKRILLTLRIETPYFYTHIISFYQFPIFFNFSFPLTLSHHLQINKMILDFILTFPSNFSIEPEPTSSTISFISKGSSISLNASTKSNDIKEFYDKIVEINSLLHSRIMYNDQTLQDDIMINEPDILQYESTFKPQKFFKSIFHYPKFDFFIDMIHIYINNPQKVRSTINFLLICIKEDFNLNLLYVILKIYNLLKIHESVIDEILERSITHVDFTLDIYQALGTVTDGFYKFFFNSAHNAVKKDTISTQIDFKNIPEYKQDFILNTFFLIRKLKIPEVKLSKLRLFKGYILSDNEFIDIITTINTNYIGAYEACLKIDQIDLFHIPQLVQLLRNNDLFDLISKKL